VARIRSIKPEFWVDDQMVELPFEARLLFIGLWNFVDDDGLIEYKPKRIKMQVFPADDVDVETLLETLVSAGRLRQIDSDQGTLLWVVNWHRHQQINRPAATKFTGLPEGFSVNGHGGLTEDSRWNGKEGKGKEGNGRETLIPSNWKPTAEHVARARSLSVDLDREAESFRAHAEAHGRKLVSWNGGFTQWLLKSTPAKKAPVDWMNR